MPIVTVNGPIEPDELGLTLAHEHIFCDTSGDFRAPPPQIASLIADMGVDLEQPISLPSLGFLWREPQWSVSNQILESYEDAVDELRWAQRVGVKAVIDPTPIGLGRMPEAQRRLSAELGMHVVAGTGYYRDKFHPPKSRPMTIAEIEDSDPSGASPRGWTAPTSAPGSSESSAPVAPGSPNEEKVLVAAAHPGRDPGADHGSHRGCSRDRAPGDRPARTRRCRHRKGSHLSREPRSLVEGRGQPGNDNRPRLFWLDLRDRLRKPVRTRTIPGPYCGSTRRYSTPVMETRCSSATTSA